MDVFLHSSVTQSIRRVATLDYTHSHLILPASARGEEIHKKVSVAMCESYRNVMWLIVQGANIQRNHRASMGDNIGRFYTMGTKR